MRNKMIVIILGFLYFSAVHAVPVFLQHQSNTEQLKTREGQVLLRALETEPSEIVRSEVLRTLADYVRTDRKVLSAVATVAQDHTESDSVRESAFLALSRYPKTNELVSFFTKIISDTRNSIDLRSFAIEASYRLAYGSRDYSQKLINCLKDKEFNLELRKSCAVALRTSVMTRDTKDVFQKLLISSETDIGLKIEILRSSLKLTVYNDYRNLLSSLAASDSEDLRIRRAVLRLVRFYAQGTRGRALLQHLVETAPEQLRASVYSAYRTGWTDQDLEWFRLTSWPDADSVRDPF